MDELEAVVDDFVPAIGVTQQAVPLEELFGPQECDPSTIEAQLVPRSDVDEVAFDVRRAQVDGHGLAACENFVQTADVIGLTEQRASIRRVTMNRK